jgi:amino acid transporter
MLGTCTLMVFTEMNSSAEISRLLRPTATSLSTWSSRAVSPGTGGSGLARQRDPGTPGELGDLLGQRAGAQIGAAAGRPRRRGGRP